MSTIEDVAAGEFALAVNKQGLVIERLPAQKSRLALGKHGNHWKQPRR